MGLFLMRNPSSESSLDFYEKVILQLTDMPSCLKKSNLNLNLIR